MGSVLATIPGSAFGCSQIITHQFGVLTSWLIFRWCLTLTQSWRGQITSVSHAAQGAKLITALEILRVQPDV